MEWDTYGNFTSQMMHCHDLLIWRMPVESGGGGVQGYLGFGWNTLAIRFPRRGVTGHLYDNVFHSVSCQFFFNMGRAPRTWAHMQQRAGCFDGWEAS